MLRADSLVSRAFSCYQIPEESQMLRSFLTHAAFWKIIDDEGILSSNLTDWGSNNSKFESSDVCWQFSTDFCSADAIILEDFSDLDASLAVFGLQKQWQKPRGPIITYMLSSFLSNKTYKTNDLYKIGCLYGVLIVWLHTSYIELSTCCSLSVH